MLSHFSFSKLWWDFALYINNRQTGSYNRCQANPIQSQPKVAVSHDNHFSLIDIQKHQLVTRKVEGELYRIDWRNDGNLLLFVGGRGMIGIYDFREARITQKFKGAPKRNLSMLAISEFGEAIQSTFWCARWSPDGNLIATASNDGNAKILDYRNGKTLFQTKICNLTIWLWLMYDRSMVSLLFARAKVVNSDYPKP